MGLPKLMPGRVTCLACHTRRTHNRNKVCTPCLAEGKLPCERAKHLKLVPLKNEKSVAKVLRELKPSSTSKARVGRRYDRLQCYPNGTKTEYTDDFVQEVRAFFNALQVANSDPSGYTRPGTRIRQRTAVQFGLTLNQLTYVLDKTRKDAL